MAAARKQFRIPSTELPRGQVSDTTQAAQTESKASVAAALPTEIPASQSASLVPNDLGLTNVAAKESPQQPAKAFARNLEGSSIMDTPNEDISEAPLQADKADKNQDRSEFIAAQSESSIPTPSTDKLAEVNRLLSTIETAIPPALLGQLKTLQAQWAAHAASATGQPPNLAPRVVVNPPQGSSTVGVSMKSLSSPPSPSKGKLAAAATVERPSQDTSQSQATPKAKASSPIQKVVKTVPQPQTTLNPTAPTQPTSKPALNVEDHNIFGERIVKDRFRSRQDSLASSATAGTMDSAGSVRALFEGLTLADKTQAREQPSDLPSPVEAAAANVAKKASKAPPEPVNEGIVQPRFNVRQTPSLIDSAVGRQYARQPVKTPPYATANPFATPTSEVRSRETSRTPSAEPTPSSHHEPSPFSERFPTVPYNWSEAPRRAASTNASKKQLPAFLQGLQPSKDPAGAARAQYGGIAPSARVKIENRDPRSENATTTSSKGSTVALSGPSGEHAPQMKSGNEHTSTAKDPRELARKRGI